MLPTARLSRSAALVACLCALLTAPAPAQAPPAIVVESGGAAPGQPDPAVTYLAGPSTSAFGTPFTASDFMLARTGPAALVRPTIAGGWPRQLPASATARWIDVQNGSASALYAIPFQVTQPVPSAVLTLQFVADDYLGDPTEAGVYVNEQPVAGTTQFGGYYFVETAQRDVGALLQQGQNWLYLYLHNTGGAGGLLFRAELQVDGSLVTTYGAGCQGSAGTPLLLPAAPDPLPGSAVTLDFYSLPLGAPVALLLGSDNRTAFGMPTPADLGFLGFAGCDAWLDPVAILVVVSGGGGAQVPLTLPGQQFVGQSLYAQGFVFDTGHPRGAAVSNAVELRAGY